jgi:hypothetical protein
VRPQDRVDGRQELGLEHPISFQSPEVRGQLGEQLSTRRDCYPVPEADGDERRVARPEAAGRRGPRAALVRPLVQAHARLDELLGRAAGLGRERLAYQEHRRAEVEHPVSM